MEKSIYILGIESSCDDTSAAVICNGKVLSNVIANQEVHAQYGGVVPELASRAHQQNIVPVVQQALHQANITKNDLSAIAFTKGPGLMGSLLVGTSFAKSLALGLQIPLIDVNHMQAHILAHFIEDETPKPPFPFICLTISGGHTQIVKITDSFSMEILGETIDDAVGEAFDKSAKILGLPYPGGPLIDKYAQLGNPKAFPFSKPQVADLNFSFSGLKTSILYFLRNAGTSLVYKEEFLKSEEEQKKFIEGNLNDICASVQQRIVSILLNKLKKASKQTSITQICLAGGVSANSGLRKAIQETATELKWNTYIPKFEYCTDNAAMIAITGKYMYEKGLFADQRIAAKARVEM